MYQKHKVSVIMPVFNPDIGIVKSIESVLNQDYKNVELWIIDDVSTINYKIYIDKYLSLENVHYRKMGSNRGPGETRNRGLKESNGQFVAFIDSDDTWKENKLSLQLALMEEKKAALSYTAYQVLRKIDDKMIREINVPKCITYRGLLKNTIIGCSTVIVDRELTGEFLMPDIRGSEDTATWLSILKQGFVAVGLKQSYVQYYLSATSFSSNKKAMLKRTWRMYRTTQGLSIIQTSYYFCWYVFNAIKKRI